MSTLEDREQETTAAERPACHADSMWTCVGLDCGAVLCAYCDGIDNGSGLCWVCWNATPDHETGDAA